MVNVTYLLGAGASVGAIPSVIDLDNDVRNDKFLEEVNFILEQCKGYLQDKNYYDYYQPFREELKWLFEKFKSYSSIDTYAKKLFLNSGYDSGELKKLKRILTIYLLIVQRRFPAYEKILRKELRYRGYSDKRYDNFWASILTESYPPEHIKILSWNYDLQLELSYKGFNKHLTTIKSIQEEYVFSRNHRPTISENRFLIYKINGTAKFMTHDTANKINHSLELDIGDDAMFFEEIFKVYSDSVNNLEVFTNGITFAWENMLVTDDTVWQQLSPHIMNTESLVIIGYSFPHFNRLIDKKLFNEYMPTLKKVYIQSPDASVNKARFLNFLNKQKNPYLTVDNVHEITDCRQFYFPTEMDLTEIPLESLGKKDIRFGWK